MTKIFTKSIILIYRYLIELYCPTKLSKKNSVSQLFQVTKALTAYMYYKWLIKCVDLFSHPSQNSVRVSLLRNFDRLRLLLLRRHDLVWREEILPGQWRWPHLPSIAGRLGNHRYCFVDWKRSNFVWKKNVIINEKFK